MIFLQFHKRTQLLCYHYLFSWMKRFVQNGSNLIGKNFPPVKPMKYLYFFGYKTGFFSSKNIDLSYKMDLDLWDCLGRVKLVL